MFFGSLHIKTVRKSNQKTLYLTYLSVTEHIVLVTVTEQQNISRYMDYCLIVKIQKVNTQNQTTIFLHYERISSAHTLLWQQTCRLFLHLDSWLVIKDLLAGKITTV